MPKKCQLGDYGKGGKSLTYPQGNLPEVAQPASMKALALTRPCVVCVVQEGLAIVGQLLTFAVNHDETDIALGSGPRCLGLLGVPDGDGAAILAC